jgi:hypothetical protein
LSPADSREEISGRKQRARVAQLGLPLHGQSPMSDRALAQLPGLTGAAASVATD